MPSVVSGVHLKVADEVWIIAVLLQQEHPDQPDFSVEEIMDRARREKLTDRLRPGFYVHVIQHCVANRAPNPGRYRMLIETSTGRRRLFRHGDSYQPEREVEKSHPPTKICQPGTANSWTGTGSGLQEEFANRLTRTRCYNCGARAGVSGPMNMLMTMCGGCARDGNEPHLLGYEYLHLSLRRLCRTLREGSQPALPGPNQPPCVDDPPHRDPVAQPEKISHE